MAKADVYKSSSSHYAGLFTELIFNYGEQFDVEGENTESFVSGSGHCIISGLKTSPFRTTVAGKHLNVGFILKPNYYGQLLDQFAGKNMEILSETLYQQLIEPEIPRFHTIENALAKFFRLADIGADLNKFEKHILPEHLRNGVLKDFSDSNSISQKSFISRFKRHYALTPGQYLRLRQVNYATKLIQTYEKASFTEVGAEAGFYDQSHFIRVFKRHHGCTPKQFRKSQSPAWVNSVQF